MLSRMVFCREADPFGKGPICFPTYPIQPKQNNTRLDSRSSEAQSSIDLRLSKNKSDSRTSLDHPWSCFFYHDSQSIITQESKSVDLEELNFEVVFCIALKKNCRFHINIYIYKYITCTSVNPVKKINHPLQKRLPERNVP